MAEPRAVKKKKVVPTNPTKPAKAPHVVELDEFDPSQVDTVLSMLFARHEPITDDEREAFGLLVSDAQADELGSRTQASDIRALAVRWAPVIDAGVRDHGAAVEGFSSARFVHLLERTQALHLAIRDDEDKRNKVGSVRTAVDSVRAQAKTARDTLYRALRTYAGQRAAEREALAAAYGTADPATRASFRRSRRSASSDRHGSIARRRPLVFLPRQPASRPVWSPRRSTPPRSCGARSATRRCTARSA